MGTCFSSAGSEEEASLGEQEGDEAVVYVGRGDELSPDAKGRRIVSLCSRQGKKGPNQDAAILCEVRGFLQRKRKFSAQNFAGRLKLSRNDQISVDQ